MSANVPAIGIGSVPESAAQASWGSWLTMIARAVNQLLRFKSFFPSGPSDIRLYGGKGDGITDNAPAIGAALAAGVDLYFPAGTYIVNSKITRTLPTTTAALTIKGDGSGRTKLVWPNATGGLEIHFQGQYNALHLSGLTIAAGIANAGTGLALVQDNTNIASPAITAQSTLDDVTFQGSDGLLATDYWTTAITSSAVSNVAYRGLNVFGSATGLGAGIKTFGTSATYQAVVHQLYGGNFINATPCLELASYSQGITITNTNFTGGNAQAILISGTTTVVELNVTGAQFNTNGHQIQANTGTAASDLVINGNLFYIPAAHSGIELGALGGPTLISNNEFHGGALGTNIGVHVVANNVGDVGVISGNEFDNLATGIKLDSGASNWTVGANGYTGNGTNLNDGASGTIYPHRATIGGTSLTAIGAGLTRFVGPCGQSATLNDVLVAIPFSARAANLYAFVPTAPGVGQTIQVLLSKNGSPSALTCTISGTSETASDTTHSVAFAAGDVWNAEVITSAGAASTTVSWGVEINKLP